MVAVNRDILIVSFLESSERTLEESDIPNCYHYGANPQFIKSPKIPVLTEGRRVPSFLILEQKCLS